MQPKPKLTTDYERLFASVPVDKRAALTVYVPETDPDAAIAVKAPEGDISNVIEAASALMASDSARASMPESALKLAGLLAPPPPRTIWDGAQKPVENARKLKNSVHRETGYVDINALADALDLPRIANTKEVRNSIAKVLLPHLADQSKVKARAVASAVLATLILEGYFRD